MSFIRKLSPLMKIFIIVMAANNLMLGVTLYAHIKGEWNWWEPLSGLTLGLAVFVSIGLMLIYVLANKRMGAIADTASQIVRTGDLSKRIPGDGQWGNMNTLTGSLNHMLEEIEQLLHSVRTVSDNIAHDLRHPLTRLRNHVEEMRNSIPKDSCPDLEEKFSNLVSECDAMLGTFQAILRIANIEQARRHGGFREVNLKRLIEDVLELYEPLAASKDITVATDLENALTLGDKDLLFQAFANLIDNAIKYTPEGGAITIGTRPHEQHSSVSISDTGKGVSDEHKPYIFRRFYRIDPSRTTPGVGLGLSLVGAIISLHKGKITLSDSQPRGLTVTVDL
jgi:signal transduction histidine kinase